MGAERESDLYALVERWLRKRHQCFRTAINKGLSYGRIDVLGVRDVGGELSGEVELIAVEVKRGTEAFGTASGQALGYSIYANRVYLADQRSTGFTSHEVDIAGHLGIGLVAIAASRCQELLSSPYHRPVTRLQKLLLESLHLGTCQLCDSCFQIGDQNGNKFARVGREKLRKALEEEKGLMFWNREVGERKSRLKIQISKNGGTRERRFLCPDCLSHVVRQFGKSAIA